MRNLREMIVLFSTVCYLATSSIASVHAFPMSDSLDDSDSVVSKAIFLNAEGEIDASIDQQPKTIMACHQGISVSLEKIETFDLCKIFCSATGHGLLLSDAIVVASIFRPVSYSGEVNTLTSRQLTVEHQPPK